MFTAGSGRRAADLSAGILTWFSAGFLRGFRLFRGKKQNAQDTGMCWGVGIETWGQQGQDSPVGCGENQAVPLE